MVSTTSVTMSRAVQDRSGQLRNCWAGRNACYAVAGLTASPESDPPSWIRGHWHIETALHPYVTYREGRAQIVSLRKSCDGGCGVLRGRRLRHAGRGAWICR